MWVYGTTDQGEGRDKPQIELHPHPHTHLIFLPVISLSPGVQTTVYAERCQRVYSLGLLEEFWSRISGLVPWLIMTWHAELILGQHSYSPLWEAGTVRATDKVLKVIDNKVIKGVSSAFSFGLECRFQITSLTLMNNWPMLYFWHCYYFLSFWNGWPLTANKLCCSSIFKLGLFNSNVYILFNDDWWAFWRSLINLRFIYLSTETVSVLFLFSFVFSLL